MGSLLVAPKGRRIQARLKPMRIHCDGAALARAAIELGLAHLPSLRLEGGPERLKLEAFDTDLWIHADLPAEVEEPGAVLLPAAMFSAVGSHLGHGITTLSCDGQRLVVQAGDVRVELPAFRNEPRPTIPIPSVEFHQMRLWGSSLAKACRVLFAVDNSHPVLEGIHLQPVEADRWQAVAAVDPYRRRGGRRTSPPHDGSEWRLLLLPYPSKLVKTMDDHHLAPPPRLSATLALAWPPARWRERLVQGWRDPCPVSLLLPPPPSHGNCYW